RAIAPANRPTGTGPSPSQPARTTERPAHVLSNGSVSVLMVGWAYELVARAGCCSRAESSHRQPATSTRPQSASPAAGGLAGAGRGWRGPRHPVTTTATPTVTTAAVAGQE